MGRKILLLNERRVKKYTNLGKSNAIQFAFSEITMPVAENAEQLNQPADYSQ